MQPVLSCIVLSWVEPESYMNGWSWFIFAALAILISTESSGLLTEGFFLSASSLRSFNRSCLVISDWQKELRVFSPGNKVFHVNFKISCEAQLQVLFWDPDQFLPGVGSLQSGFKAWNFIPTKPCLSSWFWKGVISQDFWLWTSTRVSTKILLVLNFFYFFK